MMMRFFRKIVDYLTGRSLRETNSALEDMTKAYLNLCNEHDTLGTSFDELSHEFTAFKATQDSRIRAAESAARKDSRKKSQSTIKATVYENVAPLLPNFNYDFNDVQWMGRGVDLVVWDGFTRGEDIVITFVDVKTGRNPGTTHLQRAIKKAIDAKRVKFRLHYADRGLDEACS